jgi:beta-glucosidase-like glycosyl hydrolase
MTDLSLGSAGAAAPRGVPAEFDSALSSGFDDRDLALDDFDVGDDVVLSDDDAVDNLDDDHDDAGSGPLPVAVVAGIDDVKGRAESELAFARDTPLNDEKFVAEVTESKLPDGAKEIKHLGQRVIVFVAAKSLYQFPTTLLWRSSVLKRADQGLKFADNAVQMIVKFLFSQHPEFPVQIALAGTDSFSVSNASSFKKGQVWLACKGFRCAAAKDFCRTTLCGLHRG